MLLKYFADFVIHYESGAILYKFFDKSFCNKSSRISQSIYKNFLLEILHRKKEMEVNVAYVTDGSEMKTKLYTTPLKIKKHTICSRTRNA